MIGRTVFRRTMSLVLSAVLLCAGLTLLIYSALSPGVFAANRGEELLPKARIIAQLVESRLRAEISLNRLMQWIGGSTSQWNAYVWVVNTAGDTVLRTRTQGAGNQPVGTLPTSLAPMVTQVLTGQETTHIGRLDALTAPRSPQPTANASTLSGALFGDLAPAQDAQRPTEPEAATSMVVVGVPVAFGGQVVGAVVMGQTMGEVVAGMRSLTNTLMLGLVAATLILIPLSYLVASRMSRPMRQMRDAALAMAAGDFTVRADTQARGEIGELGGALNVLSGELGRTISALVMERNRLRRILNGLTEGIVAVDADGRVTHVNPAMRTLFHVNVAPAAGEDQPMALAPYAPVWAAYDAARATGTPQTLVFAYGEATLQLSVSALEDEDGAVGGAVGVFRDITQAQRLEQTRRDYVANVSHELRTPLTALRALIEPLRDGLVRDEAERDRLYNVMLRETLRLSRLVSDMLELSRLQTGAVSLEQQAFDPARMLRDVYTKFAPHAEDHGQALILDLPDTPLPQVRSNSDRAEQVLVALLDNAIKYTPEGGRITLQAVPRADALAVTVRDDGPGIALVDLPHVFDRFYKADRAHQGQGTGLGLAIAKEILTLLGENITVESALGQGAAFTFTLHYGAGGGFTPP
ncbi:MAG: cell wall metabolism sensor histidine kinase WalK [Oscillospiraceae bacterium]|jgi:two-component system sensor histidine kinase ResE|nr:cell wall metabolism sensor histidine kinase WalK [Oscillospiraceae bacterium]